MAGGTGLLDAIDHRVLVAVGEDLHDALGMTGGSTLVPKFGAGSRPIVSFLRLEGLTQSLLVGPGHHQDRARHMVLGNNGDQSGVVEPGPEVCRFFNIVIHDAGHTQPAPRRPCIARVLAGAGLRRR